MRNFFSFIILYYSLKPHAGQSLLFHISSVLTKVYYKTLLQFILNDCQNNISLCSLLDFMGCQKLGFLTLRYYKVEGIYIRHPKVKPVLVTLLQFLDYHTIAVMLIHTGSIPFCSIRYMNTIHVRLVIDKASSIVIIQYVTIEIIIVDIIWIYFYLFHFFLLSQALNDVPRKASLN